MEAEEPAAGAAKKSGNFVTRKVGPLPLWLWVVGGVSAIVIYKRIKGGSSTTTGSSTITPTSTVTSGAGLPSNGGYTQGADNAGLASLVQQLQGQLSNSSTTPTATSNMFTRVQDWTTNAELALSGIQQYVKIGNNAYAPAQIVQGSTINPSISGNVASPGSNGATYYLNPGQAAAVPDANGIFQGSDSNGPLTAQPMAAKQAPVNGTMPTNSL